MSENDIDIPAEDLAGLLIRLGDIAIRARRKGWLDGDTLQIEDIAGILLQTEGWRAQARGHATYAAERLALLDGENKRLRRQFNEAHAKLPRWIPVTEQLPDPLEVVLVLRPPRSDGRPWIDIAARGSSGGWGNGVVSRRLDVTHWQPLPPPPMVHDDGQPLPDVTIDAGEAPTADHPAHPHVEPETAAPPLSEIMGRLLQLEALFVDPRELAKMSEEEMRDLARNPLGHGGDLQLGRLTKLEDRVELLEQAAAGRDSEAMKRASLQAKAAAGSWQIYTSSGKVPEVLYRPLQRIATAIERAAGVQEELAAPDDAMGRRHLLRSPPCPGCSCRVRVEGGDAFGPAGADDSCPGCGGSRSVLDWGDLVDLGIAAFRCQPKDRAALLARVISRRGTMEPTSPAAAALVADQIHRCVVTDEPEEPDHG